MRVALLLSERGSGLEELLRRSRAGGSPYTIIGALVTTPKSRAIPLLEEWGVPWRCHDIHAYYARIGAKIGDLAHRPAFDQGSLEILSEFRTSVLALFSYLYILSRPVLDAFRGRILNVHDGDLTIVDGGGRPRYAGLHSTWEAVLAGESSTRATVHLVTEALDAGPVVLLSPPYPVHLDLVQRAKDLGSLSALKAYAYAHREWMIRDCWGALLDDSLRILARETEPLKRALR